MRFYGNWDTTNITTPPIDIINKITWNGNKWIACAMGTSGTPIYYSYNGFDWIPSTFSVPIGSNDFYGVAWNKNLGSTYIQQPVISLGAGNLAIGSKTNAIAYSLDGIKYTGLGNVQNKLFSTGYAAALNGSMCVAVGEGGHNTIIYSYDGIEWIPIANSNTYIGPGYAVVWTGINWVVTGVYGLLTYVYYSPDGINWLPSATPNPTGVCYSLATDVKTISGGTQSTTVAVGDIGNPGIIYSLDDGVNWTLANNLPGINPLFCVAWNGTTWLTGGESTKLYWSLDGINWNGPTSPVTTTNIRSIAWNGIEWVAVGNYDGSSYQVWHTPVLDGQSGWTQANVNVLSNPDIYFLCVIWNGKRWIAGGFNKPSGTSYIITSYDGINWFESPPLTSPLNPYSNPLNYIVLGLASNSRIGGVIVDSQIALNKTNSVRLTTKLDLYSDNYYNNGYNNMVVSIKSSDLM